MTIIQNRWNETKQLFSNCQKLDWNLDTSAKCIGKKCMKKVQSIKRRKNDRSWKKREDMRSWCIDKGTRSGIENAENTFRVEMRWCGGTIDNKQLDPFWGRSTFQPSQALLHRTSRMSSFFVWMLPHYGSLLFISSLF